MELINERQRFPYVFACAMAFLVILASYAFTRVVDPAPAALNKFYWYMTRSAGFTSYILLTTTVLLGMSSSSGAWDKLKLRKLVTQMHQYAALLIFPFLFFHLWGLHEDKSVPFTWMTLSVPFIDKYRSVATGLGVLTVYGWLLLIVSSYFREKISVKVWRTIHYLSFPMFILVTLHGLLAGTDAKNIWAILVYGVSTLLFVLGAFQRIRK